MNALTCASETARVERLHYFPRQLITADDMTTEQEYFRERMRRHNRVLHGWGVVCGCAVEFVPDQTNPWLVRVCPGYAVSPQGDEIVIADAIDFDLARDVLQSPDPCVRPSPCPPRERLAATSNRGQSAFLAVRYAECDARPVRVHPIGCACGDAGCEYSRTRDSFELARLAVLPQSHAPRSSSQADKDWRAAVEDWKVNKGPLPVPACPECTDEPWVVLATVTVQPVDNTHPQLKAPSSSAISYAERHVLYSTENLQLLLGLL